MEDEIKKTVLCFLIALVLLACVFFAGFACGHSVGKSGGGDTDGTAEYASGSDAASAAVAGIEGGLGSVAGQVQDAGSAVAGGITELAGIREVGDRIAEAGGGIEGSAGRLEKSIRAVMQIIDEGEEQAAVLDGRNAGDDGGGLD